MTAAQEPGTPSKKRGRPRKKPIEPPVHLAAVIPIDRKDSEFHAMHAQVEDAIARGLALTTEATYEQARSLYQELRRANASEVRLPWLIEEGTALFKRRLLFETIPKLGDAVNRVYEIMFAKAPLAEVISLSIYRRALARAAKRDGAPAAT